MVGSARLFSGQRLSEQLSTYGTHHYQLQATGIGLIEALGGVVSGGGHLSVMDWAPTRQDQNGEGIVWNASSIGIAQIAEPWAGFNPYNPTNTGNNKHPILGQLWDMIVVHRNNNLGLTSNNPQPFRWDGQWWRYFQWDREGAASPGAAIALRVDNPQIFDGDNFTGAEAATILSVGVTTPVAGGAGGTVTVTLSAPAPSNGVFVAVACRTSQRVQFQGSPDHLITIAAGMTIGTTNFTTNDIDHAETVTIVAASLNVVTTPLSILA
jgi:hypothetical protein